MAELPLNQILCGDCVDVLESFPDESVDMILTSPPYGDLRQYMGFTLVFEELARELVCVLKEGGVLVWVVGDKTSNGTESGESFRQALFFMGLGLNLHDTMIYHKKTPPLTHDRYEQEFEYMFILSKGKPKTFNPLLVDKKYQDIRLKNQFTRNKTNEHDIGFRSDKKQKIKGNVWEYAVGGGKSTLDKIAFQHPAIFPEKLAEDHILSWSNVGDVVLDPMAGSGTTLKMAQKHNRHFIGIEISPEYVEIAHNRLNRNQLTLP